MVLIMGLIMMNNLTDILILNITFNVSVEDNGLIVFL